MSIKREQKELWEEIIGAFRPFKTALYANDSDTLGALDKDGRVLFSLEGSWTPRQEVTLGDLRKLNKLIEKMDLFLTINDWRV